jgi:small subunit ribosomal protein S13
MALLMAAEEDDFKYIVRIAATDVDGNKPVRYALTQVKGVGDTLAHIIAREADVDENIKIGKLSDKHIEQLSDLVVNTAEVVPPWMRNRQRDIETGEDRHLIGPEIDMVRRDDINRLKKIKSYRGLRHEKGLPVRGQRTRGNKRSGLAVGVSRRKLRQEKK